MVCLECCLFTWPAWGDTRTAVGSFYHMVSFWFTKRELKSKSHNCLYNVQLLVLKSIYCALMCLNVCMWLSFQIEHIARFLSGWFMSHLLDKNLMCAKMQLQYFFNFKPSKFLSVAYLMSFITFKTFTVCLSFIC